MLIAKTCLDVLKVEPVIISSNKTSYLANPSTSKQSEKMSERLKKELITTLEEITPLSIEPRLLKEVQLSMWMTRGTAIRDCLPSHTAKTIS